jgi:hypothetical protein
LAELAAVNGRWEKMDIRERRGRKRKGKVECEGETGFGRYEKKGYQPLRTKILHMGRYLKTLHTPLRPSKLLPTQSRVSVRIRS